MPLKAFFLLSGAVHQTARVLSHSGFCAELEKRFASGAFVVGLCLMPLVITLKTIGEALAESWFRRRLNLSPQTQTTFTQRVAKRRIAALRLARERG